MILVSAGHHPTKPGACYQGFCEHDEALRWARDICEILTDEHALMVPPSTLKEKVSFINARKCDLAVEIHFNSAKQWVDLDNDGLVDEGEDVHVGRGSETLYYPSSVRGKAAARIVQHALASVFEPDRGIKEGWYRLNPKYGADYFLRKTKCTALILEPEFIHRKHLIIGKRGDACFAIADALLKVVNGDDDEK